jgi:hypothetical protein
LQKNFGKLWVEHVFYFGLAVKHKMGVGKTQDCRQNQRTAPAKWALRSGVSEYESEIELFYGLIKPGRILKIHLRQQFLI